MMVLCMDGVFSLQALIVGTKEDGGTLHTRRMIFNIHLAKSGETPNQVVVVDEKATITGTS